MKFCIKLHGQPSLRLNLDVNPDDAASSGSQQEPVTLRVIERSLQEALLERFGARLLQCDLSLDGTYALDESLYDTAVDELGLVSGDLLHALRAEFDAATTSGLPGQREVPVETPQLVRESTERSVPQLLVWLVTRAGGLAARHEEQLLFVLLHALMMEAGVEPVRRDDQQPTASSVSAERWTVPDTCWQQPGGLMQTQYRLPSGEADHQQTVTLSAVSMGARLVVHATLAGDQHILTTQLTIDEYVKRGDSAPPATTSAEEVNTAAYEEAVALRFQRLRLLSKRFKNAVTVPLLVRMRRVAGDVSPHEWRALPLELHTLIARALSVPDALRLGSTCRQLRQRLDDPLLWRWYVLRDFPLYLKALSVHGPDADWHQRYIQLYKQQRDRRHLNQSPLPFLLPPVLPPFSFESPLAPPIVGIVGGEYDRVPGLHPHLPYIALPRPRRLVPHGMLPETSGPAGLLRDQLAHPQHLQGTHNLTVRRPLSRGMPPFGGFLR